MSSPEFETLRSQIETIETSLNYVKNKVTEPSMLGRSEEASNVIRSLQSDLEHLKSEISERIEITQMNNSMCKKLNEESDLLIKQIELAHHRLKKQYGFSFEDKSQEESEKDEDLSKPFSPFDASPSVAWTGRQTAAPSNSLGGKCRRLNFDDYSLRTPFASSTCRKNGRNTLTPGIRLIPPTPNSNLK